MTDQLLTQTQEAIHRSAKKHFLKYGFEKASLNQIVKESGFTKGAFYGYYASKEELFQALVRDTLKGIEEILADIIRKYQAYPPEEQIYHMSDIFLQEVPELVDYILMHREEVVLLLNCANGTVYENFFEKLQSQNENRGQDTINLSFGSVIVDTEIYHILMSGYFSMLKSIFLSEMSREKMIAAITDVQIVFQNGIMSLMNEKAKEVAHEQ